MWFKTLGKPFIRDQHEREGIDIYGEEKCLKRIDKIARAAKQLPVCIYAYDQEEGQLETAKTNNNSTVLFFVTPLFSETSGPLKTATENSLDAKSRIRRGTQFSMWGHFLATNSDRRNQPRRKSDRMCVCFFLATKTALLSPEKKKLAKSSYEGLFLQLMKPLGETSLLFVLCSSSLSHIHHSVNLLVS